MACIGNIDIDGKVESQEDGESGIRGINVKKRSREAEDDDKTSEVDMVSMACIGKFNIDIDRKRIRKDENEVMNILSTHFPSRPKRSEEETRKLLKLMATVSANGMKALAEQKRFKLKKMKSMDEDRKSKLKALKLRIHIMAGYRNYVLSYLKCYYVRLFGMGMYPIKNENGGFICERILAEQNMAACYELIKKFLGDISLYMDQSEFPDKCPDECKEAVASLMYAAANFSDLPELEGLKNIFTEKYGNSLETFVNKEFVERLRSKPPTEDMKVQLIHDILTKFSIKDALEPKLFTALHPGQPRHGSSAAFGRFGGGCTELDRTLWCSKFIVDINTLRVRLEVIREKRIAVQNYLRFCVGDLLMSGMDPNEYGAVERVLVEQNMAACYALIKKFLGDISLYMDPSEFPDECPDECKEAVASLMYAAANFSDLPELEDLKNIFTEKYGNSLETFVNKEFVRLNSPMEEMKVQLIHDIEKEFSIEWDSKALEQKLFAPLPADHVSIP